MRGLNGLWSRIFGRRRRYDDLSVSIQEHIAERAEELVWLLWRRWERVRARGMLSLPARG